MSRKYHACITVSKFEKEKAELLFTHVSIESVDPALVKSRLQTLKQMGIISGLVTAVSYGPLNDTFYFGVI